MPLFHAVTALTGGLYDPGKASGTFSFYVESTRVSEMGSEIPTLVSSEDLERLLGLSETMPVMILKHSTRCPISAYAREEFQRYADGAIARGVRCAIVRVVEDRPISLEVAEALGVRHQSPQAILVRDRKAVWTDSHEGVTASSLEEAERR